MPVKFSNTAGKLSGNRCFCACDPSSFATRWEPSYSIEQRPSAAGPSIQAEREVLTLMESKSSKEIDAQLGISFKRAVTRRASIMGKLDLHEIASVVREAIRRGLV